MYNRAKMQEIYSDEMLQRIVPMRKKDGATVDLHFLREHEAAMFVNALLIFAGDMECVRLIHGFNHGKAIQKRVRKQFVDYPMVERMVMPQENPGETIFFLKKAA